MVLITPTGGPDSPPQTERFLHVWDVKDHSPLLDEDKFAFFGENFEYFAL